MPVESYKIIRKFFDRSIPSRTIATRLTLEEAQAHCRDPETSSRTCKLPKNVARTEAKGSWFDCYTEE